MGYGFSGFFVEICPSHEAPPAGPVRSPHLPVIERPSGPRSAGNGTHPLPTPPRGARPTRLSRPGLEDPVWRTRSGAPGVDGALFPSFLALRARAASGDSGRAVGRPRAATWRGR